MKKCKTLIFLLLLVLAGNLIPVAAQGDTIVISNREEWRAFSKNCTLDTWSQGKSVSLACDIDLGETEFSPVPTFGGNFNGNGYTISGITLSKEGSKVGLFRYIQQGGTVTNLNVKANFLPGGSKSFVGGIAGENSGLIQQCSFEGMIKGEDVIGGIAGNNTSSGQIISCTSSASITGKNSTGGIAGKNDGLLLDCVNHGEINTIYEEEKNSISDLDTDIGSVVENYETSKEESEEESILGHTDTGGIVGYTSGVVQGCTNSGAVGYPHIGYNVGGIAGRQSGYLLGCENKGFIQGRKDVGGIVGQMEPSILLNASESTLKQVQQEFDHLHSMIHTFLTNTDTLGDDTKQHLSDLSEYSKNAENSAEVLVNQGTGFIDDNLNEINALTAILSNTFDKLAAAFENVENGSTDLADALDEAASALDQIELYAPDLGDEINGITAALREISRAERVVQSISSRIRRASNDFDEAIQFNSESQVKNAASKISSSIKELITAKRTIKTSLGKIETILSEKPESFEDIGINAKEIIENIKTIKGGVDTTISALQRVQESIDTILLNTKIDFSKIKSAAENIQQAIQFVGEAMSQVTDGLEAVGSAVGNFSCELEGYIGDMSQQMNGAKEDLSAAFTSLSSAAEDIKMSVGEIREIFLDLSKEEPVEFVKLSDDFEAASGDFFDAISGISDEIDQLKNTVSDEKDKIIGDLSAINDQFQGIINLMADQFTEEKNEGGDSSDIFLDVSDEELFAAKQGKVMQCQNFAGVEADRNTGGIAGAMAIEYAKDPEDDIEKPNTLNFTYRTKAILQGCINDGNVIGKKDCVGGIVGLSELGTVYECENYGDMESTDGSYVGGVAGRSESTLRKSYAKCSVSGKSYIGGIAGKAAAVSTCYSIVTVTGNESIGAVCGNTDDPGKGTQNFYVDHGLGAIDGISYHEIAEPIPFDELKNVAGIPKRFISFTVTFVADGETVETQEVQYGDSISHLRFPQIPEKDGYFGTWKEIEAETVTENLEVICEYKPYITVLASNEKSENGKLSLALAEGKFTDKAALHITESKETPPQQARGNTKVYQATLFNTDIQKEEAVTMRFLNENRDKVTAWRLKNGAWEQIKVSERGKYVVLQTIGTNSTICLQYTESRALLIWLIFIALFLVAAGCVVIYKRKKRKKRP